MELGKLGEQIVVKSPEAFRRLTFVQAIPAIGTTYVSQRLLANASAGTVRSLRQVTGCDPDYLLI